MILAILPTRNKFPASVLASAKIGPANGCEASGSKSITAGTFETTLESRTVTVNNHTGCCKLVPVASTNAVMCASVPEAARAWDHEEPYEQHQELPIDQT